MKKYLVIILILVIGVFAGYYFRDYQYLVNQRDISKDPLNLFDKPNSALDACLRGVNPSDPLGLYNETEAQKTQRQECINKYQK